MPEKKLLSPVYAQHLNSKFRCLAEDGRAVELELVRVDDLPSLPNQEQFSLIFRAPVDMPPVQKTYMLEHDELGAEEIFLVPIRQDRDGLYFESIFNRLFD